MIMDSSIFIATIEDLVIKEVDFLEKCLRETNGGGWSTHLNDPMRKRITELKDRYYDLRNRYS